MILKSVKIILVRTELINLSKILNKKIKEAKDFALKTKKSAQEIAKAAAGSWSMAGDRTHAEDQAKITQENLLRLENLLSEIDSSLKEPAPKEVKPVCILNVVYDNGEKENLCMVKNPTFLQEIKFVSADSPLGENLIGKKIGDVIQMESFSLKILSIE